MGAGEKDRTYPSQTMTDSMLISLFPPTVLQNVYSGEKYGAVTLLTSYRRSDQRLRVEVLNAVNLLPMDSNGKTIQNGQKMHIAHCCVTFPDDALGSFVRLERSICAAVSGARPHFS